LTGIPGSVGGAVYMNAGTVNGSICQLMDYVRLARESGEAIVDVTPERYAYRRQALCGPGDLILEGRFRFERSVDDQRGVYEHYMKRRREKQPQGRCCGSVFKNPPGDHAGRLIEACGLKGERRGGARVSPMHANFIMNEAGASCADILALIALCKRRVRERFGVELEEEVRVIG
jgi:UDP-N-acetylmuramate dehydrogenase